MILFNKLWIWWAERPRKILARVKDFFSFKTAQIYLIAIGLLLAGSLVLAWLIYSRTPADHLVIMHYNTLFGIDWIAPRGTVFWLPVAAWSLTAANLLIGLLIGSRQDNFIKHLLLAGTALIDIFILLATYSVFLINFINLAK